jgi:hypothetical protein
MPRVGFEPRIPVFERAKMVHTLDGSATVIGLLNFTVFNKEQTVHLYTLRNLTSYGIEEMAVLKKGSASNKHGICL